MPAWLKAGLIGAIILIALGLIGLIPVQLLGCLVLPLYIAAYIAIGIMAASYSRPPRSAGQGAGQGALAGGLAAVIHGIFMMVVSTIQATMTDSSALLSQMPPELLQPMYDAGVDPSFFVGPGGALLGGTLCCGAGIFFAVALAAIGGAIYASIKQV